MSAADRKARTFNRILVAYLGAILLLGGASSAGFLANSALQVAGAAILVAAIPGEPAALVPDSRLLRLLALALAATAFMQFLPLPFSLWRALPGREMVAAGLDAIGAPHSWQTLSFAPWSGFASMIWLIPAIALAAGVARTRNMPLRAVAQAIVGIALVSVLIATFQRFGNQGYFYAITNVGQGVGFFANANHQSDLLLIAILFWSALRIDLLTASDRRLRWMTRPALHGAIVVVLVAGIWITQSAAGAGLALVALAGAFLLHRPELKVNWRIAALVFAAAMVAVAGLYFSGVFADNLTDAATGPDLNRLAFFQTGWRMVGATFPFGSGLGTFADYYHWFENVHAVSPTFVNHAHDDLLELVIETGVLGLVAIVLFAAWWLERARTILARRRSSPYPLAALLSLGVVFAHSAVDYPLRTAAISSLLALCCVIVQRNPAKEPRSLPTPESGTTVVRRI